MQGTRKIAVAGATGRVGRHVVEILEDQGHDVAAIARSRGVDVITGEGLAEALEGAEAIVDASTGPSPEEAAATEFFVMAMRNLQNAGRSAGVQRLVVVSIIGADRFPGGYGAAKVIHERMALDGPIPATVLRAAQFHEFVPQLLEWGTRGDTAYVPTMRTQLVSARTVAEALARMATGSAPAPGWAGSGMPEIAGPREERLAAAATLFIARRGDSLRVEEVSDPSDPIAAVGASGGLLPGPDAILAGPTFATWLETSVPATV
jgi:uncharacterized protein YbjT (DUF2867 family)